MEDKFSTIRKKIIDDLFSDPFRFLRDFIRIQETFGNKKEIVSSSLTEKEEGSLINKKELCCIANEVPYKDILADPSTPPVCFIYKTRPIRGVEIVELDQRNIMIRKIPNVKIYNGEIPYIPLDTKVQRTDVAHFGMDQFTTETLISFILGYYYPLGVQKLYISTLCNTTGVFFYEYPESGTLEDIIINTPSQFIRYYKLPFIDGLGQVISKDKIRGGFIFPGMIHFIFNDVYNKLKILEDTFSCIHGNLDISNVFVNFKDKDLYMKIGGFKYSTIINKTSSTISKTIKLGHVDENFKQPKSYNSVFTEKTIVFNSKDLNLIRNGVKFSYVIDYMVFWVSVLMNPRVFYQVITNPVLNKYYWKNIVYRGEENKLYQRITNGISKKLKPTCENICNEILNGMTIRNDIDQYFVGLLDQNETITNEINNEEYMEPENYFSSTEDEDEDEEGTPKERTPKEGTPKEETPKEETPKEEMGSLSAQLRTIKQRLTPVKK